MVGFGDSNLKKGKQKCKLWLDKEADGLAETTTGSVSDMADEIERLEKVLSPPYLLPYETCEQPFNTILQHLKRQELGEIPRCEWLDQLVFREIERMNSIAKRDEIYLIVEFPRYDFPVVYADFEYPPPNKSLRSSATSAGGPMTGLTANSNTNSSGATVGGGKDEDEIDSDEEWPGWVWDPEAEMDNPCELKHRRLVRSHRNGPLDKELKPNAKIRDELHVCLLHSFRISSMFSEWVKPNEGCIL